MQDNQTKSVGESVTAWVPTRVYLLAEGAAAVAATVSVEIKEFGGSLAKGDRKMARKKILRRMQGAFLRRC
jgi:hypothetical protein